MSKAKKEMKKELKEKMKGKIKVKVKKKMKKIKLILIILATLSAVVAAIKTVLAFIEKKHKNDPKREGLKDVTAFFSSKNWKLSEPVTSGFMIGSYFSNLNIDLSECTFEDNSFIAIKCGVGRVCLTLPQNVNIKFDSIGSAYYLKKEYDVDAFDESLPTVYVALKVAFGCVFVTKAENTEEKNEENSEVSVENAETA
ncbi:MAG: hypothetical protein IKP88_03010 [Lachnospiraceae bacterium]|nr:hypothetical protein [Lachnospiraceae bacterium]